MNEEELIDAFTVFDRIERLPRTGYLMCGIRNPETVAAHTASTAWLTGVLADSLIRKGTEIDRGRAVEMAVLHETGECFIGDLVPGSSRCLGPGVKEKAELVTGSAFLEKISPHAAALFREYLEGVSPEARLVRDCDRLQLLFKAALYRRDGFRGTARLLARDKYDFHYPQCRTLAETCFNRLEEESLLTGPEDAPWEGNG